MFIIGDIYNKKELGIGAEICEWLYDAINTHGISFLSNIRGSFVAELQSNSNTVLVRDQFGSIPLYYYTKRINGKVVCGTSVRDLLSSGVPRKLSKNGLFTYLSYGCVYAPYTMIEDVFCVPPGCVVKFNGENITLERYWRPSFGTERWESNVLLDAIRNELKRAIAEQVAEGRPGAFLSGGIDSSSIVALWRQQYEGEIRTYCVTHEDRRTDEREWARKVATQNHTSHTELMLEDRMIMEWLPEAITSYDQPSIDGLNFWFATKLVKAAGEKVMLSGEGGDELFMGYDRFVKHQMAYRYAPIARCLPRIIGTGIDRLVSKEKYKKLGMLIGFTSEPYYVPRRIMSDNQISSVVSKDVICSRHLEDIELANYSPFPDDLLNRISWLEMQTVVPDMWMRDAYQTSHSNGVAIRTPICDARLAELLYTVPSDMKCSDAMLKPLLVAAAGSGLPVECAIRKKQGFTLPFDRYFSGVVKEKIDDFIQGKNLLIFNRDAIRKIGMRYRNGQVYWSRVWALFMCENWCRENLIEI